VRFRVSIFGIRPSIIRQVIRVGSNALGEAMRLAIYGAVLAITLGSVLLGLDWVPAPMSPMVDTQAGLRAVAPPPVAVSPAPAATVTAPVIPPAPPVRTNTGTASAPPSQTAPVGNIGAPIISPNLSPNPPPAAATAAQGTSEAPAATPEPPARCNVDACTAAYRSFTASDCTYLPSNGPRRLCAK
jgi:hypothetical protein